MISEARTPEGPSVVTSSTGEGTRIIQGAPAAAPIVQNNFISQMQSGSKKEDPPKPEGESDFVPPVQGGDK